jgi:uncharacterized membrane protein
MKLLCPHCGVKGSADDSYHGRTVKCPKCGGNFSAVSETAPAPQDDFLLAPDAAEEQNELDLLKDLDDFPGNAQEMENEPPAPADDDLFGSDETVAEDITEALALIDESDEGRLTKKENTDTEAEQDEMFVWSDIASEIDRELDKDIKREKDDHLDPAFLDDFFDDVAPGEEVAAVPAPKEQEEVSLEEAILADKATETLGTDISSLFDKISEKPESTVIIPGEVEGLGEVERHPESMDKEQCWQCGKKDSVGVPFIAKDGRLYCSDCLPDDDPVQTEAVNSGQSPSVVEKSPPASSHGFTIGGLIKEAWAKTHGAKAAVWGGTAVMYLALLILAAGAAFLLPSEEKTLGGPSFTGMLVNALSSFVINVVSMIFTAGLLFIGIKKVAGEIVSWKMVFEGFSQTGKLVVATILQTLLITIGFLLLILPGIYLAIGYSMTLPLIVDRKMSPWQAMEASRKAIHAVWWKIFGLFIIMSLIFMVAMLPLGLGIIWTWPMCVILAGVLYRSLFGIDNIIS